MRMNRRNLLSMLAGAAIVPTGLLAMPKFYTGGLVPHVNQNVLLGEFVVHYPQSLQSFRAPVNARVGTVITEAGRHGVFRVRVEIEDLRIGDMPIEEFEDAVLSLGEVRESR